MLGFLKNLARIVLVLVICCYGVLFFWNNADSIAAFAAKLEAPAQPSIQLLPVGASSNDSDAKALAATHPLFSYPELLKVVPSSSRQCVMVLGNGSLGNIFLLTRVDGAWHVDGGPYTCRLGREGLTLSKKNGDNKTPMGLHKLGEAYGGEKIVGSKWPFNLIEPGAVWVTDSASLQYNKIANLNSENKDFAGQMLLDSAGHYLDIGYNAHQDATDAAGVLLYSSNDLTSGTRGGIAVSPQCMVQILQWLQPDAAAVSGIFLASDVGYVLEEGIHSNFVFLTDVVPTIREDSRYAGSDNFMGRPIDGYYGNRIVVNRYLAEALKNVDANLARQGLGLLVYDGYRPQRAVTDIFTWLDDEEDLAMKEEYYPELPKSALGGLYLVEYSPHTRGIAVDLTICDRKTGEPLDMGTGFDYFSPKSWYNAQGLSSEQVENRRLLRDVMMANGFTPYEKEWWHFNYYSAAGKTPYDFVIPCVPGF